MDIRRYIEPREPQLATRTLGVVTELQSLTGASWLLFQQNRLAAYFSQTYQEEYKGEVSGCGAGLLGVLPPTLLECFYCLQKKITVEVQHYILK